MREWFSKNQIFVFFLLLFAIILFVDDFVIDSALMALSSMFVLSFLVYKLFETIVLLLRKKRHRIFSFNFLVSLAVAIIIIMLTLSSQSTIKKNEDALAESIELCIRNAECKAIVNGMKVERVGDKNFSVTSGVVTLLFRADKKGNDCLKIHTLYLRLVDVRKC